MAYNIEKMIAHDIVLNDSAPKLYDELIDLPTLPKLAKTFFCEHIDKARYDDKTKACMFVDANATVLKQVVTIASDMDNGDEFIRISKIMTQNLFSIMKKTSSKSDGILIFIQVLDDVSAENWLAVLKMDPNSGIQRNSGNSFIVQENMLPGVRERLHKFSLIKLDKKLWDEQPIHLYVLDKQKKNDEPTKYFMEKFLEAKELVNDKKMTEIVIDKLVELASDSYFGDIDVDEFENNVQKIMVNGAEFNFDTHVGELLSPIIENDVLLETMIEDMKKELRDGEPGIQFEFTVEKESMLVVYEDKQSNIKLQFPKDQDGRMVKIESKIDGSIPITTITITGVDLTQHKEVKPFKERKRKQLNGATRP